MATLERAIAIAAEAHAAQRDKAGAPYILHPLRVMLKMSTDEERIVAVLHDVVEDCPAWPLERLRAEGFSETILAAVAAVTKDRPEKEMDWEAYSAFVLRAAADPIGRKVKRADMQDNCDLSRIADPTPRDYERAEKYKRALALIEEQSRAELRAHFDEIRRRDPGQFERTFNQMADELVANLNRVTREQGQEPPK